MIGFQVLLEDGTVVDATGLTREKMLEFTQYVKDDDTIGDVVPYYGWYCEVDYMERFPDGSLRHPSWKQWRGIEDAETIKS